MELRNKHYAVCRAASFEGIEQEVNDMLNNGFELHGDLKMFRAEEGKTLFYQPVKSIPTVDTTPKMDGIEYAEPELAEKVGKMNADFRTRTILDLYKCGRINTRTCNCLSYHGIKTVDELLSHTKEQLLSIYGMGAPSVKYLEILLKEHNLCLKS